MMRKVQDYESIKKVIDVLKKSTTDRTPVNFFRQIEAQDLKELCRHMKYLSVGINDVIVEQGDEGDSFYIILTGRVLIFNKLISRSSNQILLKLVAELRAGDAFGELALIYGAPRAATVKAAEPTELMVINKAAFDKVVKQQYVDKIDERIEFFKNFPVFPTLSKAALLNLATVAVYLKFMSGETVIKQGQTPFYVYFVKAGELKAIRELAFKKVDPDDSVKGEALIKTMTADPTKEEIEKGFTYAKTAEIDTYGIICVERS